MLPEFFMTWIPKKNNLKSFLCGFGTGSGNSLREFLMSKAASQLWVTGSNVNQVSRDQNLLLQLKKLDPLLSSDTHFAMGNNNMTSTKAQDGNRAWIITVTEYPSSPDTCFLAHALAWTLPSCPQFLPKPAVLPLAVRGPLPSVSTRIMKYPPVWRAILHR